ncbi:hypothetical protein FGD67_01395 [Colwellia sp. M166]|uniref:hypothetical protein n=1 Tax=Colwellia sp. M166 TaxID=2583805 RepID=UPI00211E511E|nr:hypothetical protein [Colwellia sp. M166]UUO22001.1 hypothetical protein FGD67_01395 [Colwellia sp. M166]
MKNLPQHLTLKAKSIKKLLASVGCLVILTSFIFCQSVKAMNIEVQLQQLSEHWAHTNFELNGESQENAFVELIGQVEMLTFNYPMQADAWAWSGIIKSTFAQVSSSLSALSYIKAAKKDFEHAIELNSNALTGAAYSNLGMLYHKAPIWPIAFGDDDIAEALLKQALVSSPDNKLNNFFYAQYLFNERRYHHAKKHLLIAKQVPLRAACLIEDKYRQVDIELLLVQVEKIIAKESSKR